MADPVNACLSPFLPPHPPRRRRRRFLRNNPQSRPPLHHHQLVPPPQPRPLLHFYSADKIVNAAAALVNLSLERQNKVKIVRSGIAPPLIDALRGGHREAAAMAEARDLERQWLVRSKEREGGN